MGIRVDYREKSKFLNILKAKGLKFSQETLLTGDVICYDDNNPEVKIVIERKRIDDLISSYYSNRLETQFERLSNEKFAILIITGDLKSVIDNFPFKVISQIVEEVISLAIVRYNFRSVIWLLNGVEDCNASGFTSMVKCIDKIVKGGLDNIPQRNIKVSRDVRVNSLRSLLGVNENICKRLLKQYGNVRSILDLSDEDLIKVKGIGPVQVKRIRFILDGNIKEKKNMIKVENKKSFEICLVCKCTLTVVSTSSGRVLICKKCIGSV